MTYLVPDPDQSYDHLGNPEGGEVRMIRVEGPYKRRRGGHPSKLSEDELIALYRCYRDGESFADLGRRVWRSAGYSTEAAASLAIRDHFIRRGWKIRTREEGSRLAGEKRRESPVPRRKNAAYLRWWKGQKRARPRRFGKGRGPTPDRALNV